VHSTDQEEEFGGIGARDDEYHAQYFGSAEEQEYASQLHENQERGRATTQGLQRHDGTTGTRAAGEFRRSNDGSLTETDECVHDQTSSSYYYYCYYESISFSFFIIIIDQEEGRSTSSEYGAECRLADGRDSGLECLSAILFFFPTTTTHGTH
jgi:hypothetical protein